VQDSANPNLQYEAAVGYRSIGTLNFGARELQKALELFDQSIAILDRLSEEYPAAIQFRHQLAWSSYNRGRALLGMKRLPEARDALRKAVVLYEELSREKLDSGGWPDELALSWHWFAHVAGELGDSETASELLGREIDLLERLSNEQPDNLTRKYLLAQGLQSLALVSQQRGDENKALDVLGREQELLEPLLHDKPDDVRWKDQLAQTNLLLSELDAAGGKLAEAKAAARKSADLYWGLYEAAPTVYRIMGFKHSLTMILKLPGDSQLSEADELYRRCQAFHDHAPTHVLADPAIREQLSDLQRLWASKLRDAGQLEQAEQILHEPAAASEPGKERTPP
jgi:tetratricopeptide (TPR) repeat protein